MKQPIPIFEADIVGKKLKLLGHVKRSMSRWVSTFPNGAHVDITIRRHKTKRTNDQNAYYFGVVIPILAEYFGHDNPDDMHEDLKREFNPVQSKIDPGKTVGGSTTKLSTVEFFSAEDSYVKRICRWALMEHSVEIPPPEKAEAPE